MLVDDNVHVVLFIHKLGLLIVFFLTRSLSFMDCCTHLSGVLFSPSSQICCCFLRSSFVQGYAGYSFPCYVLLSV
jgi:hypothetical protein